MEGREREKRERKKERERWPGIKLAMLWCTGQHIINWPFQPDLMSFLILHFIFSQSLQRIHHHILSSLFLKYLQFDHSSSSLLMSFWYKPLWSLTIISFYYITIIVVLETSSQNSSQVLPPWNHKSWLCFYSEEKPKSQDSYYEKQCSMNSAPLPPLFTFMPLPSILYLSHSLQPHGTP